MEKTPMIVILGPTATGKTRLAALLADRLNGEILSADSRQVFKRMNIGTGKDYSDYVVEGRKIPFHLIDVVEPGQEYNLFNYKTEASRVVEEMNKLGKQLILCGGSGMYLESILGNYQLAEVPVNQELRTAISHYSDQELMDRIRSFGQVHNITDFENRERMLRAIEIREHTFRYPSSSGPSSLGLQHIFGILYPREEVKKRIWTRLQQRLNEGMVQEVENLLKEGISAESLHRYGLEYRWITVYLKGEVSHAHMQERLYIAICQFSKRQMTWFRGMERRGYRIHWLDGNMTEEEKILWILKKIQ